MQNRRNIGIAHYMLISLFRTADSAKRTFKRIKELGIDYFDVGAMWTQRRTEYLRTDFEIEYDYNCHRHMTIWYTGTEERWTNISGR